MLERKGAGVDKPGVGPCGSESGELLLLYNETSNDSENGSGPKFEQTAQLQNRAPTENQWGPLA